VQFCPDFRYPGGGDGDTFGEVRSSVGHVE